jgi:hypothetical protein
MREGGIGQRSRSWSGASGWHPLQSNGPGDPVPRSDGSSFRATDEARPPDARLTRDQNHTGSRVVQAVQMRSISGGRPTVTWQVYEDARGAFMHGN